VQENEWNIALHPVLPDSVGKASYDLTIRGKLVRINIEGKGIAIDQILFDGQLSATAVIPDSVSMPETISIKLGTPKQPYLHSANSALVSSQYDAAAKKLVMVFRAFPSHENSVEIVTSFKPQNVFVDGKKLSTCWWVVQKGNYYQVVVSSTHNAQTQEMIIQF